MTKPYITICTLQPQQIINDCFYTVDHLSFDSWIVEAAEFEELTGDTPSEVEENSFETDRLRDAKNAPQQVKDWDGPYEVNFEVIWGMADTEAVKEAVHAHRVWEAECDRDFLGQLVSEHLAGFSDVAIAQMVAECVEEEE